MEPPVVHKTLLFAWMRRRLLPIHQSGILFEAAAGYAGQIVAVEGCVLRWSLT